MIVDDSGDKGLIAVFMLENARAPSYSVFTVHAQTNFAIELSHVFFIDLIMFLIPQIRRHDPKATLEQLRITSKLYP